MFDFLIDLQRAIYGEVADQVRALAAGGGWAQFLAALPIGILFGAAHALTPGHSKTILASYLAGSPAGYVRAILASSILSATHVASAVAIALLSLPLISLALGDVGRAPALEAISRLLLAGLGLWMILRAVKRRQSHSHRHEIATFGILAGLVPCPLTLFVMILAIANGVPAAGLAFAVAMAIGVTLTLSAVAVIAVWFRSLAIGLLAKEPRLIHGTARILEGSAGAALMATALVEIFYL